MGRTVIVKGVAQNAQKANAVPTRIRRKAWVAKQLGDQKKVRIRGNSYQTGGRVSFLAWRVRCGSFDSATPAAFRGRLLDLPEPFSHGMHGDGFAWVGTRETSSRSATTP
jgi:hypothetical protein